MRSKPVLVFALCFLAVRAAAWDVSGWVVDKLSHPIPAARICLEADPARCAEADAEGRFHWDAALSRTRPGYLGRYPIPLEFRGEKIVLTAARPVSARLEGYSLQGRSLFPAAQVELAPGRNPVAVSGGLPEGGVFLLRVSTPAHAETWKAARVGNAYVSRDGGSRLGAGVPAAKAAPGGTAAGARDLAVSRDGYRTRVYTPGGERESGVYIALAGSDDSGYRVAARQTEQILSIDRARQEVVTRSVRTECDGGAMARDTLIDTLRFALRDGLLYTWHDPDCEGLAYAGGGADILGTWTAQSWPRELPAGIKPADCRIDTVGVPLYFTEQSVFTTITDTDITSQTGYAFCPGDLLGPQLYSAWLRLDSAIAVTGNTCRQTLLKNKSGESAALDYAQRGDTLEIAFAYKGKNCAFADRFPAHDPQACPDPKDGEFAAFNRCLLISGFAGPAVRKPDAPAARPGARAADLVPRSRLWPRSPEKAARRSGEVYISFPWTRPPIPAARR